MTNQPVSKDKVEAFCARAKEELGVTPSLLGMADDNDFNMDYVFVFVVEWKNGQGETMRMKYPISREEMEGAVLFGSPNNLLDMLYAFFAQHIRNLNSDAVQGAGQ